MQRPTNLKVGDQFRVIVRDSSFELGEIITLKKDDNTNNPFFWKADKSDWHCTFFSSLKPYTKTVRDAQVGDVVIDEDGEECMVLERGQNSVVLSCKNNLKIPGYNYTFDGLEKQFTLKAE